MDGGVLGNATVVLVNGYELTAYLNNMSIGHTVDSLDATTFANKKHKSYGRGKRDAKYSWGGLWDEDNVTLDALDDVLHLALADGADGIWTALQFGDSFGQDGYGLSAFKTKYEIDDAVAQLVQASGEVGVKAIDRVAVLHPLVEETATGNGTDLNDGATGDTLNGGVGYLQVPVLSQVGGDSLTVKVQHSVDGTTWVDLITFAAVTAEHKAQRVEVAGTIHGHVRAQWTLSSGANATFHVAFARS